MSHEVAAAPQFADLHRPIGGDRDEIVRGFAIGVMKLTDGDHETTGRVDPEIGETKACGVAGSGVRNVGSSPARADEAADR